jgi:hypothetical protein
VPAPLLLRGWFQQTLCGRAGTVPVQYRCCPFLSPRVNQDAVTIRQLIDWLRTLHDYGPRAATCQLQRNSIPAKSDLTRRGEAPPRPYIIFAARPHAIDGKGARYDTLTTGPHASKINPVGRVSPQHKVCFTCRGVARKV